MLDMPISDIILKIPISVQNLIQKIYTSNQWGLVSLSYRLGVFASDKCKQKKKIV